MITKPQQLNFNDYIKMLPSSWAFEHFINGADVSRKILSSSMVDEAVERFSIPENLNRQFLGLKKEDRLRCSLVYLSGNAGLYQSTPEGLEDSLVKSFLVYAARSESGEVRLFGFSEFRDKLKKVVLDTILESATVDCGKTSSPFWSWRMLNDITVIIALAAQKILKKKRSGGLTRASSMQLKKLIEGGAPPKSEKTDYIPKMVIRYCIEKEMLYNSECDFYVNFSRFNKWLALPVHQRFEDFSEFVFKFTGGWDRSLLEELLCASGDKMISSSVFPLQDRSSVHLTLRALRFAGFLEIKRKGDDLLFYPIKRLEQKDLTQESKVIILPDFSALFPQEIDTEQIYRFSRIAKLTVLDKVYKGKIEKAVLSDSISAGVSGDMVLEWLEQWSAPANVVETVREWIREIYRLFISEQSFLVSNDKKVTEQICSYEPLVNLIEPVSAHKVFRIKKGNEDFVKEILKTLGFDYRMPGQELDLYSDGQSEIENAEEKKWVPLTDTAADEVKDTAGMRGTKYGAELKELDLSEIIHVVDYAILTGQPLIFDYEGSPYVKEAVYTVIPVDCQKGIDPILEGIVQKTRSKRQFYIKKIRKIGVLPK